MPLLRLIAFTGCISYVLFVILSSDKFYNVTFLCFLNFFYLQSSYKWEDLLRQTGNLILLDCVFKLVC